MQGPQPPSLAVWHVHHAMHCLVMHGGSSQPPLPERLSRQLLPAVSRLGFLILLRQHANAAQIAPGYPVG